MNTFSAYGKFLITSEYLILKGAEGLAIPLTKTHQILEIASCQPSEIIWQALDEKNELWFEANFSQKDFKLLSTSDESKAVKLQEMLTWLFENNPELFTTPLTLKTQMNFSPQWGLGSSSTLISLLSQWSGVDAYQLQNKFFPGSGYDVACARSPGPIVYSLAGNKPVIKNINWRPEFREHLYFIYRGIKQDSRQAIKHFNNQAHIPYPLIEEMNKLTQLFIGCQKLEEFQNLIEVHEQLIGKVLNEEPVKYALFPDFPGAVKSLGGWGGDFLMIASEEPPHHYFQQKGHTVIFNWNDLIH